jgi:hypothetical protein
MSEKSMLAILKAGELRLPEMPPFLLINRRVHETGDVKVLNVLSFSFFADIILGKLVVLQSYLSNVLNPTAIIFTMN